ncbi:FMN-binding protein [Anaerotignum sp.]|uniref:FMN-binding protein n=1 Tax=Anaerotignum sp. TaxID=2039241 RepID=UPI0027145EDF|nr:FMN-binding protein [Anaerotignum sp.]
MLLLLNVTLAWISVGLMVALSIIYLLRIGNKYLFDNKNQTLKKWNKRLRKHHRWMGILVIFTGLLHGILSSFHVLSFNFGTILVVVFILLGLSFMLRKIFSKGTTWIKLHRFLTILAFVLLILHIVEVGGFVGVDGIKNTLKNDPSLGGISSSVPEEIGENETNLISNDVEESGANDDFDDASISETETVVDDKTFANEDTTNGASNESITDSDVSDDTVTSTPGPYSDGTYTGTADGYRPGLTVEVVIENGYIASIEVVAHNEKNERFYGEPIQVIPQEIVAAQSTDVDIVTGATFTSNGIKNAVNNALASALK